MSALELEKLSPKQKEIFKQVWTICTYFQQMRRHIDDSALAQQARNIGMMLDDLDKEESRKNKPGVTGKVVQ